MNNHHPHLTIPSVYQKDESDNKWDKFDAVFLLTRVEWNVSGL